MAAITIDEETKERLRNFVAEEEDYNKILNRLMDSIEQIDEVYVELQREKLERDKEKFISLEDYKAHIGL
jgi:predicted CopG family antitoxin